LGFEVTCVIPRWGRTFKNTMAKFASLAEEKTQIETVIEIVAGGKEAAGSNLADILEKLGCYNCPYISVAPDRKRAEHPYRIGFLGMDLTVAGITLRIEGDEPHNGSSLIKLDEADMTIVGLDELLAMNQYYLKNPEKVTKWGLYNFNIGKDTDLRIAGSANLTAYNKVADKKITDFIGFFLIAKNTVGDQLSFEKLIRHQDPVCVKGRYEELIHRLLPGMRTVSVENVEDSILTGRSVAGVEIVQTGSTIKSKGLKVFGAPLFLSESLYVANYQRYLNNPKLQQLLDYLNPLGYFDMARIEHYVDWYTALELTLGTAWINKPNPDQLFCSMEEMKNGLRPYRLQTRRWMPSDQYKAIEAEELVTKSLERIRELYKANRS
jgi:hypothetical protein